MMKVVRADAMGMCFGVRDALAIAHVVPQPAETTIYGELVHNPVVLVQLEQRGFQMAAEEDRQSIPETPALLITAHGISDAERERLQNAGKTLIDTTCPLVRRVHQAACNFAARDFHVIVIGRPNHVEVRGIVEDLSSYDVVEEITQVETWSHRRLGIVCQSTTPPFLAAQILAEIERRNPTAEIDVANTICQPTRDRQAAVEDLCRQVDVLIVVGGAKSNNSRQLVELGRRCGKVAHLVQSADEIDPAWFAGCSAVGLTAGTSTLDECIDAVHARLASLDP